MRKEELVKSEKVKNKCREKNKKINEKEEMQKFKKEERMKKLKELLVALTTYIDRYLYEQMILSDQSRVTTGLIEECSNDIGRNKKIPESNDIRPQDLTQTEYKKVSIDQSANPRLVTGSNTLIQRLLQSLHNMWLTLT